MRGQLVMALVVVCLLASVAGMAQSSAVRSVEGKVYAAASTPQSSAVVYLQDSKTNNIKSFISTQDGSYRFGQLSSEVDYQVWAEYKGKKSDRKNHQLFQLQEAARDRSAPQRIAVGREHVFRSETLRVLKNLSAPCR